MRLLRSGSLIHPGWLVAPPGAQGSLGQEQGQPTKLHRVCASRAFQSGGERQAANAQFPHATYICEFYGDPSKPPKEAYKLQFDDGKHLHIEGVEDIEERGIAFRCFCSEDRT
jgi:hypothetical protein